MKLHHFLFLLFFVFANTSDAEVNLRFPFSDNMVLQREMDTPIRGTASSGEVVTVTINGQTHTATANNEGKWVLFLEPMPAGGPYTFTAASDKNTVTFTDVMVGDVWLCTGQSNMDRALKNHVNSVDTLLNGLELLRLADGKPVTTSKWSKPGASVIENFSATGFFFAWHLIRETNVPMGFLEVAWGGTSVEEWMDPETVAGIPRLTWGEEYVTDKIVGSKWPNIVDETQFGIKGIVWYQGEANARATISHHYREHLESLIKGWRKQWGQGDFPFYVVQLPNFQTKQTAGSKLNLDETWPVIREAQRLTLNVPNTGLITTIDIGEADDIHPLNKWDVGHRIAKLARAYEYGETDLVYSGPSYKSMTIIDNQIRLKFVNVGSGLTSATGDNLEGFRVLDDHGNYEWGNAVIDGDEVVVSASNISNPRGVAYAWASNPIISLFNKEGLPAGPFITTGEQIEESRFGCRMGGNDTNITVHDASICGTSGIVPVEDVNISACPAKTLDDGASVQLYAYLVPSDANNKDVTWSSSNPLVATVDENGLLQTYANGNATITVRTAEGGFTDLCELSVEHKVVSVYGVALYDCPGSLLFTGDTHQLTAAVAPMDADDQTLKWSSSNPAVASVDENGLITALSQGTAKITVTTNDGDHSKTCNIGVLSNTVSVTGISIDDCPTDTLLVENTHQLSATISPANASDQSMSWASSNEQVATVDESGTITAIALGSAEISVTSTDGAHSDWCLINVDNFSGRERFHNTSSGVEMYPNPANNKLHFKLPKSVFEKKLKVYRSNGQLLFSENTFANHLEINVDDLVTGEMLLACIEIGRERTLFKVLMGE